VQAFFDRWMRVIPAPFTPADRAAGYWWELSMRQVEVSRTLVFDDPRRARGFFEALVTDNIGIGRPDEMAAVFAAHPRTKGPRRTKSLYRTRVFSPGTEVKMDVVFKHSRIKQYLNCDMRSHAASGCVERRVGLCRRRSPGQRRKTCPRRDVRAGLLGWRVRSSRESPRVNASELLLMPR
jgi:hypothetical protein